MTRQRDLDLGLLGPIDWQQRLVIEKPFLDRVLADTPSKRVLDLGCGSGEHAEILAESGFEVVGIDASEEKLERARRLATAPGSSFVLGDIGAVEAGVRGHFGAAICLGDTLPSLLGAESVSRMMFGLRRRLLPGAPLILQLQNFERIYARRERHLPLLFLPTEDGDEIVLLRLLDLSHNDVAILSASALRHAVGGETPLEVLETRCSYLQAWRHEEIKTLLEVARFTRCQSFDGMTSKPFHTTESQELVMVAR